MKKIIAILVCLALLVALTACGNSNKTEKPAEQQGQSVLDKEEPTEKQEAKYESENLSSKATLDFFKKYYSQSYSDGPSPAETFENINGRIVDVYEKGNECYILTSSNLYCFLKGLHTCTKENIDIENNTKIVIACEDVIILSDNENNYSLYAPKLTSIDEAHSAEKIKWEMKEFVIEKDDLLLGGETWFLYDEILIITDTNKKYITFKTFSFDKIYEEDCSFKYLETENLPFKEKLNAEIKETLPGKCRNEAYYFLLLENGDLSYMQILHNSVDADKKPYVITEKNITDRAEEIWNTNAINQIVARLKNDDKTLHFYSCHSSDSECKLKERKFHLPENLFAKDVKEILYVDANDLCVLFENGDVYLCRTGKWYLSEEISNAYKECGKLKCINFLDNNIDSIGDFYFLFDDGHWYSLNDEIYE